MENNIEKAKNLLKDNFILRIFKQSTDESAMRFIVVLLSFGVLLVLYGLTRVITKHGANANLEWWTGIAGVVVSLGTFVGVLLHFKEKQKRNENKIDKDDTTIPKQDNA